MNGKKQEYLSEDKLSSTTSYIVGFNCGGIAESNAQLSLLASLFCNSDSELSAESDVKRLPKNPTRDLSGSTIKFSSNDFSGFKLNKRFQLILLG